MGGTVLSCRLIPFNKTTCPHSHLHLAVLYHSLYKFLLVLAQSIFHKFFTGYFFITIYTLGTANVWYEKKIILSCANNTIDTTTTLYYFNYDINSESPYPELTSKKFDKITIDDVVVSDLSSVSDEIIAYITIHTDSSTTTKLELNNYGFNTNSEHFFF